MKLYIKNMVCGRCKSIVKDELDKLGVLCHSLEIGELDTASEITSEQRGHLNAALRKYGFEIIDDHKNGLIEKLKQTVIDLEHFSDEDLKMSFQEYISLNLDDTFISLNTLFTEIEGTTIEKFVIMHKVEQVKEMLVYDDLTLLEIANKLHYSSMASLSTQFKSITGLTPSHFMHLQHTRNKIKETN